MSQAEVYSYGGQGIGQLFGAAATILGANANVNAARAQRDMLNQSADFDIFKGKLALEDIDRQAGAALQAQKASYAAQNVDLASESVSQVREESMREAARAKNLAELDAAMSAWGKREQGRIGEQSAVAARKAARIGAAGQVIGGVASLGAAGAAAGA